MPWDSQTCVRLIWILVAAIWMMSSIGTKPVVAAQSGPPRRLQIGLLISAGLLLFTGGALPGVPDPRLVPPAAAWALVGIAIAATGASFAIISRLQLGRNWSGHATLKDGHELITTGPYAMVRHPIYTGLFVAAAGTAVAGGRLHQVVGVVLLGMAFELKRRAEEGLLLHSPIGAQYAAYRQSTPTAFIPLPGWRDRR